VVLTKEADRPCRASPCGSVLATTGLVRVQPCKTRASNGAKCGDAFCGGARRCAMRAPRDSHATTSAELESVSDDGGPRRPFSSTAQPALQLHRTSTRSTKKAKGPSGCIGLYASRLLPKPRSEYNANAALTWRQSSLPVSGRC
jgi:hypothetical protein